MQAESPLPGHKHSGIHGGRVVLPAWDLIVAEVPSAPVLLILPVAEALQGPLSMVPNGQLGLQEIGVSGVHLEKQRPRAARVYAQATAAGGDSCSLGCHSTGTSPDTDLTLAGMCRDPDRGIRGLLLCSNEDYVI